MTDELLIVELLAPVIAALVVLIVRNKSLLSVISILSVSLSLIASLALLSRVVSEGPITVKLFDSWLVLPGIKPVGISFTLDFLSVLISLLVCGLAVLILIYSISYMDGDENYPDTRRYWFLMLIFVASMLVVVNSDNFIVMFIGWEGMSLSSYLLIGYYYGDERKYWIGGPPNRSPMHRPSHCSYTTFLIVGSADTLMLLGIAMIMSFTGSPYYEDLLIIKELTHGGISDWVLTLSLTLFLIGPLAKSAQFPLNVWLPYAMAGPTPVSALLHSATMVKAGVYLVLRLLPYLTEIAYVNHTASLIFYLLIASGVASTIVGAVNAGRAVELKRVLAYSTISQIGYMFILLGVAGFSETPSVAGVATLYHLINHALFKSALFLTAGILIHVTDTIYLNEMRLHLKDFKSIFIIALISCLSLIGVPPLIGFWSKEFIIETITNEGHYALFLTTLLATFLTAFYATRMLILAFDRYGRASQKHYSVEGFMYYPSLILALATLLAGIVGLEIKGNLLRIIMLTDELKHPHPEPSFMVMSISVTLLGVLIAGYSHDRRPLSLIPHHDRLMKPLSTLKRFFTADEKPVIFSDGPSRINILIGRVKQLYDEYVYLGLEFLARTLKRLFTSINYTLSLITTNLGGHSFRYLRRLFNAVGYADMDTYLAAYVVTLTILLMGVLILLR